MFKSQNVTEYFYYPFMRVNFALHLLHTGCMISLHSKCIVPRFYANNGSLIVKIVINNENTDWNERIFKGIK